jgi:L-ascorbate metabolism protein UlaG (beta-lactamase superfamily)
LITNRQRDDCGEVTMRLIKYSHSCVRLERSGAVLVIDPGQLSERAALDGVDAVLITHEHFDHLDVDALTDALAKRPAVALYTHPEVTPKMGDLRGAVTEVVSGQQFTAAGFTVRAYGGLHAMVHPEVPRVANLGFFVEGVYHPGDSFDVPTDVEVETLFVPLSGPWLKLVESVEFVRAVAPRRAYALHDALLSTAGYRVYDANMTRLANCEYARLAAGETVQV